MCLSLNDTTAASVPLLIQSAIFVVVLVEGEGADQISLQRTRRVEPGLL